MRLRTFSFAIFLPLMLVARETSAQDGEEEDSSNQRPANQASNQSESDTGDPTKDNSEWVDNSGGRHLVTVGMQGYRPSKNDDYRCVGIPVPFRGYIVSFTPTSHADRVHHMILDGCTTPYKTHGTWDCLSGPVCASGQKTMYAWARNAPPLKFPDGAGMSIGNTGDGIRYLVLQVHYAQLFDGNVDDYSRVTLEVQLHPPQYIAAIYLFMGMSSVPPKTDTFYVQETCKYPGQTEIYPFAFRTHTHGLGRVVSAFVYHDGEYTLIGKRNPQWPQMFQEAEKNVVIKPGDWLSSICRYNSSSRSRKTHMGATGNDEMCNFYMMYFRAFGQADPFANSPYCTMQTPSLPAADRHIAEQYPESGKELLPYNEELEMAAHQSSIQFGVNELSTVSQIGTARIGQIGGLALDPVTGNLYIFHRGAIVWGPQSFDFRNRITHRVPVNVDAVIVASYQADSPNPKFVSSFGANKFYMPHGIYVDSSSNVWLTDVGLHQVFKYTKGSDGKMTQSLALGQAFTPGRDVRTFCKPTAVVTIPDGSIYVADGYCNTRVVKFSSSGQYISQFGQQEFSRTPSLTAFAVPHDLSVDTKHSTLWVSDREHGRVISFDFDGNPKAMIRPPLEFTTVYSADNAVSSLFFIPGRASVTFGPIKAFAANTDTNQVAYSFQPKNKPFQSPHVLRVSPNGQYVYVGEVTSPGVLRRFEIKREQHTVQLGGMSSHSHTHQHHNMGQEAHVEEHRQQDTVNMNKQQSNAKGSTESESAVEPDPSARNRSGRVSGVSRVRVASTGWSRLGVVLMFAIIVPTLLCCIGYCYKKKMRTGNVRRFDFSSTFRSGRPLLKDRNGFKPLRTDDADNLSSSDSDQDDTLYTHQRPTRHLT